MLTLENIRANIQPIPQKIKVGRGKALHLTPTSKFCLKTPEHPSGPVKTAGEEMVKFLQTYCGGDCLSEDGIAVTLELGDAPKNVKNPMEAYRIVVNSKGVTITGFGDNGLFYGVVSFKQMCQWNSFGLQIPAVEILDWPDKAFRGIKEECRYGSNVMEKQDWLDMIDDLASKKFNRLCVALYGCWKVQYDGRVAEYLYIPLDSHPELNTPQTVKYYSPTEKRWFDYETLPPIFRDNFYGELVRYGKQRGIDVFPAVNSMGHNTFFPHNLHEVSAKNENGEATETGFCTSSKETYKLLFSIYDQLVDNYMTPYDIHDFVILLDEVFEEYGVSTEHPEELRSAWCKCEKCREQDMGDLFINHAIKIISYLKSKGVTSIMMANDMVCRENKHLGFLGDRFCEAMNQADLTDVLLLDWWAYFDRKKIFDATFKSKPNDFNLRSVSCPWNGYDIWSFMANPMRDIQYQAEMDHEAVRGEGLYMYALWSKSYDRMHDCLTDYAWNYKGAGSIQDVTRRYVARHFAPLLDEAMDAYRLLDFMTEEHAQYPNTEYPEEMMVSPYHMLRGKLTYYVHCYYANPDTPYPRAFPGGALKGMLTNRWSYERALYAVASMAKDAVTFFEKASATAGCDKAMAERMVYECRNIQTLAQDGLAWFGIYDLIQVGDQKKIATIARQRLNARLSLMAEMERVKSLWEVQGAGMRNHSVHMKVFEDIAVYIENTEEPQLDIFDISPIMSKEHWNIR